MSAKEQVLLCGAYDELSVTGYLQSRIHVPEKHKPGASQVLWLKMVEKQERSGKERQKKNISEG